MLPDVHDFDLPLHVVIDLALLAVLGLALPDVHVHVILFLALLADVGFVLPDVHVLPLQPWLAGGPIARV